MALIIYPDLNWDSYISLADAEALLLTSVFDLTKWNALTTTQKEVLLRQASLSIKLSITDPEELSTPLDLQLATVYLTDYSISNSLIDSNGKENLKRIKIDGAIEKEYFTKSKKSNSFPDLVKTLLQTYGYSSSTKILRS